MQSNSNRDRNCCTATQRETRAAWLFLLPSLTGVVLFVLLPFAETVRRSLFDTMGTAWVGLSNYRSVIQNGAFQLAVHNTARFLGICLPILLSGSLVLALVLHSRPLRQTRAARIFKTTFLLPIAIPVASIVLLWQTLFARQGLCNGWLTCLGVQPIDFMGTGTAFWVLTGTYLWKNCGYTSILWTAGLEAIPVDQYEAARVDGAGTWQQFWHITWPELQPTLALTLILSLLNAFKVFREAYLVAGRYPQQSIYLLQHLFNNWFLSLDLPRLAAAAVLVALVLLVVILGLLSGQICPTARARLCIGQRTALDLFRADTALIGGVGADGSFFLAVLSGLGFCQFSPLMPHKSCRLFRSRTRKICRFLLLGVGVIFPRGGAGLFLCF